MRETSVWSTFRRWWPGFAERLEAKHAGVPDVHWIDEQQNAGWTELKLVQPRSKGLAIPTLKLEQAIWLNSYARAGGRCCIFAGSEEGIYYVLRGNYREMYRLPLRTDHIVWQSRVVDEYFVKAVTACPTNLVPVARTVPIST